MNKTKFGSGEYNPTPSHCLPAFIGGKPSGYVCVICGHIQKELDPVFEDLCLICLKEWAFKQGVSRLISTADAIEKEKALEPTKKIIQNRSEATTVIMNLRPKNIFS